MINVFIAGAQKAGTTSLKSYLAEHPDVITHEQMEMTFFYLDEEFKKGESVLIKNYGLRERENTCVVAKHATMTRSEKALERLSRHNPKCKIIFCTRNPVERAFSSYLMEKRNGSFNLNFAEVMEIAFSERNHWFYNVFVDLGLYQRHIESILKYFPETQLKLVPLEDLQDKPSEVTQKLFYWLGLDSNVAAFPKKKFNTKEESSAGQIKKIGASLPIVKNVAIRLFGRRNVETLARNISGLMNLENSPVQETLDQYPEWKERLLEFYRNSPDKI